MRQSCKRMFCIPCRGPQNSPGGNEGVCHALVLMWQSCTMMLRIPYHTGQSCVWYRRRSAVMFWITYKDHQLPILANSCLKVLNSLRQCCALASGSGGFIIKMASWIRICNFVIPDPDSYYFFKDSKEFRKKAQYYIGNILWFNTVTFWHFFQWPQIFPDRIQIRPDPSGSERNIYGSTTLPSSDSVVLSCSEPGEIFVEALMFSGLTFNFTFLRLMVFTGSCWFQSKGLN